MKRKLTRKRRNKRQKRDYFTEVHQEAIVRYATTTDFKERDKLYEELIEPAFSEMVDKIVYTYKFTNLANIGDLKAECKIWLTTILDKFDPDKGYMAFSYYSVITKNWFSQVRKKNAIRAKRETQYEDITQCCAETLENEGLIDHQTFIPDKEEQEFWDSFWKEFDSWGDNQMKENKRKVYNAVRQLFRPADNFELSRWVS